jgi:hypothetical protein
MCLCYDYNDQRLARCSKYDFPIQLDDLDYNNKTIEPVCSASELFDLFTPTMSSIYTYEYFLYLFILVFSLYITNKQPVVQNLPVCAKARWGKVFEFGEISEKLLTVRVISYTK